MKTIVVAENAVKYDAPEVEVVEVMVEQGFVVSPVTPGEGDATGGNDPWIEG